MITNKEIFRTIRLLGQLAVEMNHPDETIWKRGKLYDEYNALQTALEKDLTERGDDSSAGVVNVGDFDMANGKHLVISGSGVTQHKCGVSAVAECLRNNKSSLVCEAIDVMVKEEE